MATQKQPAGSSFWQVVFPAILAAVLLILVGVWIAAQGSAASVSRYAEISTVLLVIPTAIASLVFGLILVGVIYLVSQIMHRIPPVTGWILKGLEKVREAVGAVSKRSAGVVIGPASFLAGLRRKKPPVEQQIKLED